MNVQGIGGATGAAGVLTISAIDPNRQYMEFASTTFGGTYTSGGSIQIIVYVTAKAGTGGTPAGGGLIRLVVDWEGNSYFK